MGCDQSKEQVDPDARIKSKALDSELRKSKEHLQSEIKILLLGIGESGKSTIAKQMKIIYLAGFSEAERRQFVKAVRANVLVSMKIFALASVKLGVVLADEQLARSLAQFAPIDPYRTELTDAAAATIKLLWATAEVRALFARQSEYFLPGCVQYFLDSLDRVSDAAYVPSEEDILRCRVKTTAVIETCFQYEDTRFRIVDVGGQRAERSKWIHCFSDVNVLVFFASLGEYDLALEEDPTTNRMHESLTLWEEIVNSRWFLNKTVTLVLNKTDVFEKKFPLSPLSRTFVDFPKDGNVEQGKQFIADKFLACLPNRDQCAHFFSCATQGDSIRPIIESIMQAMLTSSLESSGLL